MRKNYRKLEFKNYKNNEDFIIRFIGGIVCGAKVSKGKALEDYIYYILTNEAKNENISSIKLRQSIKNHGRDNHNVDIIIENIKTIRCFDCKTGGWNGSHKTIDIVNPYIETIKFLQKEYPDKIITYQLLVQNSSNFLKSKRAIELKEYGIDSFDCDEFLSKSCGRIVNSRKEMISLDMLIDNNAYKWCKTLGYKKEFWDELKKYLKEFNIENFIEDETNI